MSMEPHFSAHPIYDWEIAIFGFVVLAVAGVIVWLVNQSKK